MRLTEDRPGILVIVGSLENGTKELVAVVGGQRESKLSWQGLLSDLKRRGLKGAPKLAVGDGAQGFWAAMEEKYPAVPVQRCWVHKTANVLSPTRSKALEVYADFGRLYGAKYPKAWECLR